MLKWAITSTSQSQPPQANPAEKVTLVAPGKSAATYFLEDPCWPSSNPGLTAKAPSVVTGASLRLEWEATPKQPLPTEPSCNNSSKQPAKFQRIVRSRQSCGSTLPAQYSALPKSSLERAQPRRIRAGRGHRPRRAQVGAWTRARSLRQRRAGKKVLRSGLLGRIRGARGKDHMVDSLNHGICTYAHK